MSQSPAMRHPRPCRSSRSSIAAAVWALLAACAAPVHGLALRQPVVLLGEAHDHPQQHALRLAAHGFAAHVPEPVRATLAGLIQAGHGGRVNAALARRMALAPVARDQSTARAIEAHAARAAVLPAGKAHRRTEVGVPRRLSAATRSRSEATGIVEEGDATTAFDRRFVTPVHAQPDP